MSANLLVLEQGGDSREIPRVSLGLVALAAAAVLVYVSGSFMFAEVLGIKRGVQIVLVMILLAGTLTYGLRFRLSMVDPLMLFVLLLIGTELTIRGKMLYVLDGVSTLLALVVIASVPTRTFWLGARFLVWIATAFSVMALVQWVILYLHPYLSDFRLFINDEGVIQNSVKHPVLYLGLFGENQFSLFGRPVARLQSFTLEPSLNVVYFMLPAGIAMLMNRPLYFLAGVVIMLFCILSLSGSVFLSLLFTLLWLPFLAFVPLRHLFSFGLLGALAGYLYAMQKIGVEVIAGGLAVLTQYGDFLGKGTSMTVRGMAASENLGKALASPLGSTSISDMAGPWIINATLVAGWLGTVVIVVLLFRLGRDVELLNRGYGFFSRTRLGTLLFLGAMSTIVAFNDYQMSNYAGIVLLAFAMRMIRCRNEAESGARPLST